MAPTCRYWARGDCRKGADCKYEHPREPHRNDNRFAGFQSNDYGPRNGSGRPTADGRGTTSPRLNDFNGTAGRSSSQNLPYTINKEQMVADLSTERPQWILSAYGPGVRAPAQLFGGPGREQSFEEMRLHYYQGVTSGNEAIVKQQADSLVREAESQMRTALSNIDSAIEYIRNAENQHPNRIDICQTSPENRASVGSASNISSDMTSRTPMSLPPTFAQPSALGQTSNFDQSSALGVKTNPFSMPPQNQNAGFSNFAGPTNSFVTPSQLHPGQPWANPINTAAIHGSFANSQIQRNPFGPASQALQFKPGVEVANTGLSNPFDKAPLIPLPNPFSGPSTISSGMQANPFARPSQGGNPESNNMAGVVPNEANASFGHQSLDNYTSRAADGRLKIFKGNQVIYRDNEAGFRGRDGTWEKIWFPSGAPPYSSATELDESAYTAAVQASYSYLMETGSFNDGVMPFVPPKRAWCRWDF